MAPGGGPAHEEEWAGGRIGRGVGKRCFGCGGFEGARYGTERARAAGALAARARLVRVCDRPGNRRSGRDDGLGGRRRRRLAVQAVHRGATCGVVG
jgi:hypothetical protein